jgi:hypothetical protein
MPIWNPVSSAVNTERSLPDTWHPERQLYWHLNAHTLLRLAAEVRGLAPRKHWIPVRQSSHTGGFQLAYTIGPMSAEQHKQIGIRQGATSFNMRIGLKLSQI